MTTTITRDEAMARLEAANAVRLPRAEFRRRLAQLTLPGGCLVAADLIERPPEWAETWAVFGVLMAIRAFGPQKVTRALMVTRVEHQLRVGELTASQRTALCDWLRARAGDA